MYALTVIYNLGLLVRELNERKGSYRLYGV
jgi:hypothetical protein